MEDHFAVATEPAQIAEVLRAIDGYKGTFIVQSALRLAPLVFVRPGELRRAKWTEFDLDESEWMLKLSKQKTSKRRVSDKPGDDTLIVPLSRQALEILVDLYSLTGKGAFVFPGARTNTRPMSENAVLAALRRLGIPKEDMCGHGFRATARTILSEKLHIKEDLIEHEFGHQVIDTNGRAYNRTSFLPERQLMMRSWADYLDKLKVGDKACLKKARCLSDIRSIMVRNYD